MSNQPPHIFVASHHKSGTVWMMTVFKHICQACDFGYIKLNTDEPAWGIRPDKREYMLAEMERVESQGHARGVFYDFHSTTPDLSEIERARGIHVVRDPRDMLISAVRYHATSDEAWLDEPTSSYGGMTFREKLGSTENYTDKIKFELDTYMGEEFERMASFSSRPDFESHFIEVRYEDLIVDSEMKLFRSVCGHLGLSGDDLEAAEQTFWRWSIFGGMRKHYEQGTHSHIKVARAEQWRDALDEQTHSLILDRVGGVIEGLGYPLE